MTSRRHIAQLAQGPNGLLHLTTIEREDGVVIRLCDANRVVTVDGEEFTPVGAPVRTARESKVQLEPSNLDFNGYFDVEAITHDDLRAGKYINAKVTDEVTSLNAPWIGRWRVSKLIIRETRFNGVFWEFRTDDLIAKLNDPVGRTAKTICDHDFGDSICGVDLSGPDPFGNDYTSEGATVSAVEFPRQKFTINGGVTGTVVTTSNLQGNAGLDFYKHGTIQFTSGANMGLRFDVRDSQAVAAGHEITLAGRAPFAIEVNDEVTVVAGCDGRYLTCVIEHENGRQFGGFPFMPGPSKLIQYPEFRTE